jgi:hypothetical protein
MSKFISDGPAHLGPMRGQCFERFAIEQLCSDKKLSVRNSMSEEVSDFVGAFTPRDFSDIADLTTKQLSPSTLYVPVSRVFPAVDAFASNSAFQMTLNKLHPISPAKKFQSAVSLIQPDSKVSFPFYFVVPEFMFASYKQQKWKALSTQANLTEQQNLNIVNSLKRRCIQHVIGIPLQSKRRRVAKAERS